MPFAQPDLYLAFAFGMLFAQLAGLLRVAEKLLLSEAFLAYEALQISLVSKMLPLDKLLPFALSCAAKLVALQAASMRVTKALMKRSRTAAIIDTMRAENELFGAMLLVSEAKEAFTSFFAKRKQDFFMRFIKLEVDKW